MMIDAGFDQKKLGREEFGENLPMDDHRVLVSSSQVETALNILEAFITSLEPSILGEALHCATLVVVVTLEHDLTPDLHVSSLVDGSNSAILSTDSEFDAGDTLTKASEFGIPTKIVTRTIGSVVD
jgi:hypothetical protein